MEFGGTFYLSVLFSLIGTGYFIYGKKQQKYFTLLAGVILGLYPYFVSNVWLVLAIGLLLMMVPWLVRE